MSRLRLFIGVLIGIVGPIANFMAMILYVESLPDPASRPFTLDGVSDGAATGPSTTLRIMFFVVPLLAGLVGAAVGGSWRFFGAACAVMLFAAFTILLASNLSALVVAIYCVTTAIGVGIGTLIDLFLQIRRSVDA